MSDFPQPPGSYILSELHDVTVPSSVSWYPQTIGWKILAAVFVLALVYIAYCLLKTWWINRYRKEALDLITQMNPDDSDMPKTLFSILKIILIHIDSRNARLFDGAFLSKLDELNPTKSAFSDETSNLWLKSIINPKIELTNAQRKLLIEKANCWVREHLKMPAASHSTPRETMKEGAQDE
ncbi:DUF4381 domain-containing protein [Vibrio sp. STUT-A11]|uniref:DUF4381 domain-containing protein n=1 Tax=Vibrio sp. STUT-A11 TaxID=2976236 RepID=UPI00222F9FE0|nr:DUF4381 domain-containing protein [Vibrio sp. STUT-A11]BDR16152.1 hypothetical protein VspSTUT11_41280 [Vibrio sp. STUT-A11]